MMSPDSLKHQIDRSDIFAVLWVLLSYFVFSLADSTVKFTGPFFDTFTIMFWDAIFAVMCMCVYVAYKRDWRVLKTRKLKYHLIKGFYSVAYGLIIIFALSNTTLAEFYLMVFTAPIWVVIFASLMMGEKLNGFRITIVLLGFLIIAYVFLPKGQFEMDIGLLAALASGLCVGFNLIYVRKYLNGEPAVLLGGFNSLISILLLGWFVLPQMNSDMLWAMPYFAFTGLCIFTASILIAKAFHMASLSAILAPFHYSQMIYGVLIGYFLFSEVPSSRTLAGSVALALIGLALFWYDYNKNNKTLKRYA